MYQSPAPGTKILFACFPADGHFNPLTGLAKHLIAIGCDVRWYASKYFAARLDKLNIPYYLFDKAKEVDITRIDEVFPERKRIKNKVTKLNFDMINCFINRAPEYYEDIKSIHDKEFSFDIIVADNCFTGIPFIKDKMNIPVISVGVVPLCQTSREVAPSGLGLTPAITFTGKIKQRLLHFLADHVLFAKANKCMHETFAKHNVSSENQGVFDVIIKKSTLLLQIGTPGFEYKRKNLAPNIRFVGPLLPYIKHKTTHWYNKKVEQYNKVILVTQGTVEKDINKLIKPALEAFKQTNALLIVTTGGSHTEELRKQYPYDNIIIEDFIPFSDVMPYANVYITNGGYGGVLLSITNRLPLVVAGVHEGKNEINARVGYFNLGINLHTETPSVLQLRKAVQEVLDNDAYKNNIEHLCKEFSEYKPLQLGAHYVAEALENKYKNVVKKLQEAALI
ncbi:glycosyltransferase family 1 protein [Ilyomonas limi]|uniref:Glycosyltransferase family 1 protein n=2 Tax=Ilyomonas limi TaxID=2575867 RepID=A0A4U3LC09_9BACT|nr:glycosyltransferase family 1 protein [Ilyomonas limi]